MQKKNNRPPKRDEIKIHLPANATQLDRFTATTIPDESLSDIGVLPGDVAITFLTTDILKEDIVCCKTDGGSRIAKYHLTPDGFIHLEPLNDEYETEIHHPGTFKIIGRVVRFDRDGQFLTVKMDLRPVRKLEDSPRRLSPDAFRKLTTARQIEHYFSEQQGEGDDVAARLAEMLAHLLHDSPQRDDLARVVYTACVKAWKAVRAEPGEDVHSERDRLTVAYHSNLLQAMRKIHDPELYEMEDGLATQFAAERNTPKTRLRLHHIEDGTTNTTDTPELSPEIEQQLIILRSRLEQLEYLPENEAVRFQLETQIYQLEQEQNRNEWPEVIGGEGER